MPLKNKIATKKKSFDHLHMFIYQEISLHLSQATPCYTVHPVILIKLFFKDGKCIDL
jgi:hypothetical protein